MTNRILLTGATGFLGTQLLRTLVAAGHEVVVLVRPRAGMTPAERVRRLVGPGGVSARVTVIGGDLTREFADVSSADLHRQAGRIDVVIHAAEIAQLDDRCSRLHYQVNVNGTRRALELARRLNASRFYHVSTAYAAGTSQDAHERLHPGTTVFRNSYERSKSLAERLVVAAADARLRTAVFRPSIVIGHSRTGEADPNLALYGFIERIRSFRDASDPAMQRSHRLLADPKARLNFVPVDVVCQALLLAVDAGVISGIHHVTDSDGVPVGSMLAGLSRCLGGTEGWLVAQLEGAGESPSLEDARLMRQLSTFLPYLSSGPRFHRTNTDRLFDDGLAPFVATDAQALETAMALYLHPPEGVWDPRSWFWPVEAAPSGETKGTRPPVQGHCGDVAAASVVPAQRTGPGSPAPAASS